MGEYQGGRAPGWQSQRDSEGTGCHGDRTLTSVGRVLSLTPQGQRAQLKGCEEQKTGDKWGTAAAQECRRVTKGVAVSGDAVTGTRDVVRRPGNDRGRGAARRW